MNSLYISPLSLRTIYIINQHITIYLPNHIDTYKGIRIYYPDLYQIIQDYEDYQKNYILDYTEWIID